MKKKGVTLVEVIITLAIFAIVVPVVFFFYTSHYKALDKATVMSNLQLQGEMSREEITKVFMEGNHIGEIIDKEGNSISLMDVPIDISSITIIDDENIIHEIYVEDKKINYLKNHNYEGKIAESIRFVRVKNSGSKNKNMKDVNVVNFYIQFEEKDIEYEVTFNVTLRNRE